MTLKELMKEKDMTQQALVLDLKIRFNHYKAQQQVSDWVVGRRLPDTLSTYYISKILDVPMETVTEACLKSAGMM